MPFEPAILSQTDRNLQHYPAIMATDVHKKIDDAVPAPGPNAGLLRKPSDSHPAGRIKHNKLMQILRGVSFAVYFAACCASIFITQLMGCGLYLVNRELYYAYMALTKQSFALTTTAMTHIWGPTKIRISGDASVAGQIRQTPGGGVEFDFP
ncbi:putative acyltransferase [Colletotrichum sp. SAR 10_77]|nr:putative acyltransferase [Colletotrichum sp. SAR 10_77]